MAKYGILEIQGQSMFCAELMARLNADIQTGKKADWNDGLEHHAQMEADIIRLRRELNKLRKMLDPWA